MLAETATLISTGDIEATWIMSGNTQIPGDTQADWLTPTLASVSECTIMKEPVEEPTGRQQMNSTDVRVEPG